MGRKERLERSDCFIECYQEHILDHFRPMEENKVKALRCFVSLTDCTDSFGASTQVIGKRFLS